MDHDAYAVLGVEPTDSASVIRAAYLRLARQYHPDKAGASYEAERMQHIVRAYETLYDPASRAAYDQRRRQERKRCQWTTWTWMKIRCSLYTPAAVVRCMRWRLTPLSKAHDTWRVQDAPKRSTSCWMTRREIGYIYGRSCFVYISYAMRRRKYGISR